MPVTRESLPNRGRVKEKDRQLKLRQERNYNEHHRAKDLSPLDPGNGVWVPDRNSEAEVVHQTSPRSYQVATPQGTYRRNRRAVRPLPVHERENNADSDLELEPATQEAGNKTTTSTTQLMQQPIRRSGRQHHPLERLDPSWQGTAWRRGRCGVRDILSFIPHTHTPCTHAS